jgi:phosphonate transport system permease protein
LVTVLFALLAIGAYVIGYRVTQIDLVKLVTSLPKSQEILSELLHPDLVTRRTVNSTLDLVFPVPCGSAAATRAPSSGPRFVPSVSCANPMDMITVEGFDLPPNEQVKIQWLLPSGFDLFSELAQTDSRGTFSQQIQVRPINTTTGGKASHLQVETSVPTGGLLPSPALNDVINLIIQTVFMALLATTAGTLVAVPVSFLAARNIMGGTWLGNAVYTVVRAILDIVRSYESLVLATVFAFWVGFGPFAGVLALSVVTIASLGKLFSEAVENIDPGPLEAVTATGASRPEAVRFAVVPQVVPDFISFVIYHWDINVRISTILGFVGGGVIGFYLSQEINLLDYSKAGTAILGIVIVVWTMDFLSAEVRKRFT